MARLERLGAAAADVLSSRSTRLAVGIVAFVGAALVALVPWLVPDAVTDVAAGLLGRQWSIGLAALVAAGVGLRALWPDTRDGADGPAIELPALDPETTHYPHRETAGGEVDESLATVGETDGTRTVWHERRVRDRLRSVAVDVLATAENCSREEALRRVEAGTWTDDARAAALLGDRAPAPPLSVRVRDWASGRAFERRVDHAMAELAARTDLVAEGAGTDRAAGSTVERAGGDDRAVPAAGRAGSAVERGDRS